MQALVYLDLTSKNAFESLGGTRFKFPELTFREDVTLKARLSEKIEGTNVEVSRVVQSLTASVGEIDARPESGTFAIKVGPTGDESVVGTNVTTALPHNATSTEVAAALNTLTEVGTTYGAASVESKGGSYLITFSGESAAVDLSAVSNSLFPISFMRYQASEFDGEFIHDLRLTQAPVASTSTFARVVPPEPYIETIQTGGESGESTWPEYQKLIIPPDFRGSYQIVRGSYKTVLLDPDDNLEDIAEALEPLADDGGLFELQEKEGAAIIKFLGTMSGVDQDPLTITVFDAPEGDIQFTFSLNTPELNTLLRKSEKVTLPLEIHASLEDINDDEVFHPVKLYKGEVTIARELNYDGLSTVSSVDWHRPPLPRDYVPFVDTQVSNGQLHYATADFGDGVLTAFTIDHDLDTDKIGVTLYDNAATGSPLVYGTDYTYSRVDSNSLTLTFTTAPAYNDYMVIVLGLEETSYFDAHTHTIAQIVGLQTILDDYGSRLTKLEQRSGTGNLVVSDDDNTISAAWRLPEIFEVYPSREEIAEVSHISEIDTDTIGRARGLLAAVHDATTESLPSPIPAAATAYEGRVFENDGAATVLLPGGQGHRSVRLKVGEFAACDGRLWYPVTRYGDHAAGTVFTTDYASDANELASTDHELSDGARVQLTTTDTLPDPLAVLTDYEVLNRTTDTLELTTVGGSTPITLTDDGVGTHTVTKAVETSYYPKGFERELFTLHVNEKQLRLRKVFEVRFGLEMAVLKGDTSGVWTVAIEIGEKTAATTPATPGSNLDTIVWRGTPILEQQVVVTPVSGTHRFGARITREEISEVDTLTTKALLYGASEGGKVSPKTNNFAIRARLIRFDTEDNVSDPTGYIAVKGLTIDGVDANSTEGTATIQ